MPRDHCKERARRGPHNRRPEPRAAPADGARRPKRAAPAPSRVPRVPGRLRYHGAFCSPGRRAAKGDRSRPEGRPARGGKKEPVIASKRSRSTMRHPRKSSSRSPIWIAGLSVLLLAAGGISLLVLDGGGEPPRTGDAATVGTTPAAPEVARFESAAPTAPEARPIETAPISVSPVAAGPVLAALPGTPVGGVQGMVVNRRGEPVPGVALSMYLGNALVNGLFPGARQLAEARTLSDRDGRFALKNVPVDAPYVVVGEHDEYARSEQTGLRIEQDRVLEGVVLVMEDGAVVRGTVSSEGGGLLPNARVELYNVLDMTFQKPENQKPSQVVFTNAAGQYAFAHVSSASIKLVASFADHETQTKTTSHALDVAPKDDVIDFVLQPGASLPGRAVDEAGRGLAGVNIEAISPGRDYQGHSRAVSDANGYFLLDGLGRTSPYQVRATREGYSDHTMNNVTVSAGQITLTLAQRGAVTGWVTDRDGKPVTSFTLYLMRAREGADPHYLSNSRSFSSAEGWFQYDNLDPGLYLLEGRAEGFADTRSDSFSIERDAPAAPQVRLTMFRGGTLTGTVYGPDRKPLAGARVSVNENNFIDSSISRIFKQIAPSDERERLTVTDGEGKFTFAHVTPGVYQVAAEHGRAAPRVVNDVSIVDDDLGGNRPLELSMPPGARLAGQAVDTANRPLTFCKVQISRQDSSYMDATTTDQSGAFSFDNLSAGDYQITVSPSTVDGEQVHPFVLLVYAQKSMKNVYLSEGQQIDGFVIQLRKE